MAGENAKRKVLILAALLGVITALLIYKFLSSRQTPVSAAASQVSLVTAAADLPTRGRIDAGMVTTAQFDAAKYPPEQYLVATDEAVGRYCGAAVLKGQPIRRDCLVGGGITVQIPPDMRAVTIAIDPVSGVGGFPNPGDKVDVVAAFNPSGVGDGVVRTVLQDVQLLALGSDLRAAEPSNTRLGEKVAQTRDTATLLVTPDDAEKLVLADSQGKLRLTLRGMMDEARVQTRGMSATGLSGVRPHAPRDYTTASTAGFAPETRQFMATVPLANTVTPEHKTIAPMIPHGREIEVIRGTDVQKVWVPTEKQ